MRYKLKDFVTDEMLVECGFKVEYGFKFAIKNYKEDHENAIYISLDSLDDKYRNVMWDSTLKTDDITPYIQDLIDKGYVEALK